MAFNALTVGHDGVLYSLQGLTLSRSTDYGATWEDGAEATASGAFGDPVRLFRTGTGFAVARSVTTSGNEHGYLLHASSFDGPFSLVKSSASGEETFFTRISLGAHYDGDLDLVLAGEYGWGMQVRNLWVSQDGGQTYTSKLTTPQVNATYNSHVHAAAYDPYGHALWAAIGDADNSRVAYSYDLGANWSTVESGGVQPTSVIPMPERVAFGIDDNDRNAGAFHILRVKPTVITQSFDISPVQAGAAQYGQEAAHRGGVAFGSWPRQTADGGTNPHRIYGTGDSGRTWHMLWEDQDVQVNHLCMDYRFLYGVGSDGTFKRWTLPDWVDAA